MNIFHCEHHRIIAPGRLTTCPRCQKPVTRGFWAELETVDGARMKEISERLKTKKQARRRLAGKQAGRVK